MKIIIHGMGVMGKTVLQCAQENHAISIVGLIDMQYHHPHIPVFHTLDNAPHDADVLIDFSHPSSLGDILAFGLCTQTKLVLATTGYQEAELQAIRLASKKIALLQAYNMSYGIALLEQLLALVTPMLINDFDVEIIEKHHNQKIDAPSGTAILLYRAIALVNRELVPVYERQSATQKRRKNEVGIHSIRGGSVFGEHTVIFAGNDELIEIKHDALSKKVFANGSLKAAYALMDKKRATLPTKPLRQIYAMQIMLILIRKRDDVD